jgi:hypothetical protein
MRCSLLVRIVIIGSKAVFESQVSSEESVRFGIAFSMPQQFSFLHSKFVRFASKPNLKDVVPLCMSLSDRVAPDIGLPISHFYDSQAYQRWRFYNPSTRGNLYTVYNNRNYGDYNNKGYGMLKHNTEIEYDRGISEQRH